MEKRPNVNPASWREIERVREEMRRMALGSNADDEALWQYRILNDCVPRLKRVTAGMSPVPFDVVRVCEEMERHALALFR
jgi:hypothetical protein